MVFRLTPRSHSFISFGGLIILYGVGSSFRQFLQIDHLSFLHHMPTVIIGVCTWPLETVVERIMYDCNILINL